MAFLEVGNEGAFNGTTPVDIVPVPGASTRRLVKNLKATNRDTVAQTVIFYKSINGTLYELCRETLQPSEYFAFGELIVLDAVTEKVTGALLAAHTTTAPCFDAAFADAS